MRLVLLLLLSVDLGTGFGQASATGTELSAEAMEIEITVQVPGGGSVVAHLIEPGEGQQTVALAHRGGGLFGGLVETRRADLVVVFEIIGARQAIQSQPVNLTALGLDPAVLGVASPTTSPASAVSEDNQRWGWAALALATAALALLAYWALPERRWAAGEATVEEDEIPPSLT
jgi:hypothetical protein